MREIKYRTWIISELKMVFGYYATSTAHFTNGFRYRKSEVKVMQYTGLQDKNNKEIYEGDILEVDCADCLIIVNWDSEEAGFKGYTKENLTTPQWMLTGSNKCMKVVGNIFENSELLN